MLRVKCYFVYIMTNQSRTLYIGVTSDIEHRVQQHRSCQVPGFTAKYKCTRLVWYESFTDVNEAIQCEKRLKGWTRAKKVALIEQDNPRWEDLSASLSS